MLHSLYEVPQGLWGQLLTVRVLMASSRGLAFTTTLCLGATTLLGLAVNACGLRRVLLAAAGMFLCRSMLVQEAGAAWARNDERV